MVKVYITKCVLSFILMIEVASKIIFHNNDFKLIRTLIDTKKKQKPDMCMNSIIKPFE